MQLTKRILIEKTALYALFSTNEINHAQAKIFYERILDWEWEMWITSHTLIEASNLISLRSGFDSLKVMVESTSRFMHTLWIEDVIFTEARKRIAATSGQKFDLVDWISIIASEKLGASMFTFNKEFNEQGIRIFPRYKD